MGSYLPCVSMAGRVLLAGYPRYGVHSLALWTKEARPTNLWKVWRVLVWIVCNFFHADDVVAINNCGTFAIESSFTTMKLPDVHSKRKG